MAETVQITNALKNIREDIQTVRKDIHVLRDRLHEQDLSEIRNFGELRRDHKKVLGTVLSSHSDLGAGLIEVMRLTAKQYELCENLTRQIIQLEAEVKVLNIKLEKK